MRLDGEHEAPKQQARTSHGDLLTRNDLGTRSELATATLQAVFLIRTRLTNRLRGADC